jgi:hypothetical protein
MNNNVFRVHSAPIKLLISQKIVLKENVSSSWRSYEVLVGDAELV